MSLISRLCFLISMLMEMTFSIGIPNQTAPDLLEDYENSPRNIFWTTNSSGSSSSTHFRDELSLRGVSNAPPLRKCCPPGHRLSARLDECEADSGADAPLSLHLEWGSDEAQPGEEGDEPRGPRSGCIPYATLRLTTDEAMRRVRLAPNGTLALQAVTGGTWEVWLSPGEFCAEATPLQESPWALLLCPCNHVSCVRKCCPQGQMLKVREISEAAVIAECIEAPGGQSWKPRFDDLDSASAPAHEVLEVLRATWPHSCPDGLTRVPPGWANPKPNVSAIDLQRNGTAVIGYLEPILMDNFCLDLERNRNGTLSESIVHCAEPLEAPFEDRVTAGVTFLAILALILVIAIYILLPELRASAFGRSLMSYATCLLLSAILGNWWLLDPAMSNIRCIFSLLGQQFLQLSAAFWLNVMCWDMSLSFRILQSYSTRRGSLAQRRFITYSAYAWSGPTIISVIMLCMQLSLPSGHPYRPMEWFMTCKYFTPTANFVFLYGPMLIILLINLLLLVYIAWQIRHFQKSRRILEENANSCDACPYTGKKQLLLFTRLLWGMGVIEATIEIIVWAGSSYLALWYVTNVVDLSRAFCLFALVGCKRSVIKRLRERLMPDRYLLKHRSHTVNASRSTTRTTTGSSSSSESFRDRMFSTKLQNMPTRRQQQQHVDEMIEQNTSELQSITEESSLSDIPSQKYPNTMNI